MALLRTIFLLINLLFITLAGLCGEESPEELLEKSANFTFRTPVKVEFPVIKGGADEVVAYRKVLPDAHTMAYMEFKQSGHTLIFTTDKNGMQYAILEGVAVQLRFRDYNVDKLGLYLTQVVYPWRISDAVKIGKSTVTLSDGRSPNGTSCHIVTVNLATDDETLAEANVKSPDTIACNREHYLAITPRRIRFYIGKDKPFIYAFMTYDAKGKKQFDYSYKKVIFDPPMDFKEWSTLPDEMSFQTANSAEELMQIFRAKLGPQPLSIFDKLSNWGTKVGNSLSSTTIISYALFILGIGILIFVGYLKYKRKRKA